MEYRTFAVASISPVRKHSFIASRRAGGTGSVACCSIAVFHDYACRCAHCRSCRGVLRLLT